MSTTIINTTTRYHNFKAQYSLMHLGFIALVQLILNIQAVTSLRLSMSAPEKNFFKEVVYVNAKKEGKRVPWDVGYPQPTLADASACFTGRILDVGCGKKKSTKYYCSIPCSFIIPVAFCTSLFRHWR